MKYIFIFIINIFIMLFFSCGSKVRFGQKPNKLDPKIKFTHAVTNFPPNSTQLRYLIVDSTDDRNTTDLIFYLHGLERTEYEWVEQNGFGSKFYSVLKEQPQFVKLPVVSISLAGSFLLIEDAPKPFDTNIESLFLKQIIPYFQKKLNRMGKVYLIGHSLGGFNSLMVSLRHPDLFTTIAIISPYTAPISPFNTKEFEAAGKKFKMSKFQIAFIKQLLTGAFGNEKKWNEYNPFALLEKDKKTPYIIMSSATKDLPGFEWAINEFDKALNEKNIPHTYCTVTGGHKDTCKKLFEEFLQRLSVVD